jgi:hypothetical protein
MNLWGVVRVQYIPNSGRHLVVMARSKKEGTAKDR